jgi:hypothetical protein
VIACVSCSRARWGDAASSRKVRHSETGLVMKGGPERSRRGHEPGSAGFPVAAVVVAAAERRCPLGSKPVVERVDCGCSIRAARRGRTTLRQFALARPLHWDLCHAGALLGVECPPPELFDSHVFQSAVARSTISKRRKGSKF